MPEFERDFLTRCPITGGVVTMQRTAKDRRGVSGQLCIAFAGIGGAQFMKTFDSMRVEDFAGWPYLAM